MATQRARVGRLDVEELERKAEEQLHRLGRGVEGLRQSVQEELDVRNRVKDGIRTQPRAFYGAAAGTALLAGYFLARLLTRAARY